jgi:putative Holliday junction resolvase
VAEISEKRFLGVDLGTKRIGFAISGPGSVVSVLRVLPAGQRVEQNATLVAAMAEEYGADGVVIGLPLNMDGTQGAQAKMSRALAKALEGAAPQIEVHLYDERLTSHAADGQLAGSGLTRGQKKRRQDAVAAKVLLESFLAAADRGTG